jgi:hypothetical protein
LKKEIEELTKYETTKREKLEAQIREINLTGLAAQGKNEKGGGLTEGYCKRLSRSATQRHLIHYLYQNWE